MRNFIPSPPPSPSFTRSYFSHCGLLAGEIGEGALYLCHFAISTVDYRNIVINRYSLRCWMSSSVSTVTPSTRTGSTPLTNPVLSPTPTTNSSKERMYARDRLIFDLWSLFSDLHSRSPSSFSSSNLSLWFYSALFHPHSSLVYSPLEWPSSHTRSVQIENQYNLSW